MRIVLIPDLARPSIIFCVVNGWPQLVSESTEVAASASRVLPKFQPGFIFDAIWTALSSLNGFIFSFSSFMHFEISKVKGISEFSEFEFDVTEF